MTVRSIFVDTNVITRTTVRTAPSHIETRQYIATLLRRRDQLYISQQVIREYLTNATRAQTYSDAIPMADALREVERLRESFTVLYENRRSLDTLLDLLSRVTVKGKGIYDANIVATMVANGVTHLLTNNVSDFVRYQGYIRVLPIE